MADARAEVDGLKARLDVVITKIEQGKIKVVDEAGLLPSGETSPEGQAPLRR